MLHMAGIGILPYYLGNMIFSYVLLAIMYHENVRYNLSLSKLMEAMRVKRNEIGSRASKSWHMSLK
jgi:hypothetical protein